MKHPLVPFALCFSLGIALSEYFRPLVGVGVALLAIIISVLFPQSVRLVAVYFITLLAGVFHHLGEFSIISPLDLRSQTDRAPVIASLYGRMMDSPSCRRREGGGPLQIRTSVVLQAREVWFAGAENPRPTEGRIMASLPGELPPEFFRGQWVQVTGVLKPPAKPSLPGLFDYASFLKRQGVHWQLVCDGPTDWKLASNAVRRVPLSERFIPWAKAVLCPESVAVDKAVELVWAMVLGWKMGLTDETTDPFVRSGTMHVFAISGLHIALIAAIFIQLLLMVRIPRVGCGLLSIPAIWFYVAATGWQASAIRSALMMSLIVGGWALRRPLDLLNSLAAAAIPILIWQPGQLFLAGFQLSFGVVASIAILHPILQGLWTRWFKSEPLVPEDLRTWWRRSIETFMGGLGVNICTSLAAWSGSLPLMIHHFHLVNPVGILANIVVVPLSGLALAASLGALLLAPVSSLLSDLFSVSAWVWMHLMIRSSDAFAAVPHGSWYVASPHPLWWIPYSVALLMARLGGRVAMGWRWIGVGVGFLVVLAAVLRFLFVESFARVTVFPGGDAVFINGGWRSPNLLVNCGKSARVKFELVPYLRSQGVDKIDGWVLTHGSSRNAGGAAELISKLEVKSMAIHTTHSQRPTFRAIQHIAETLRIPIQQLSTGDDFQNWHSVLPNVEKRGRLDASPAALAGEIQGWRILVTPELTPSAQRRLLDHWEGPTPDIIITGVSTEAEPLVGSLLEMLAPRLVVVANADLPAQRRLRREVRKRLLGSNARTCFTEESGGIILHLRPGRCEIEDGEVEQRQLSQL